MIKLNGLRAIMLWVICVPSYAFSQSLPKTVVGISVWVILAFILMMVVGLAVLQRLFKLTPEKINRLGHIFDKVFAILIFIYVGNKLGYGGGRIALIIAAPLYLLLFFLVECFFSAKPFKKAKHKR